MEKVEVCYSHNKDFSLMNPAEVKGVLCSACALKMIDSFYAHFPDRWYQLKAARLRGKYLKAMEGQNI